MPPVLAFEITNGFLNSDEIASLNSALSGFNEIEEIIYSPNTNIITIKLREGQKKFSHADELIKLFYPVLNNHTYELKSHEHAWQIFNKYYHPQATIEKIKIK
ncbi:MAG: hypothetical protein N3F09_10780 [Bacteroidia bacterium]|nr:hypothetical protein [Bacteroidia bacterium]